jgi:Rieske Fe-S protein
VWLSLLSVPGLLLAVEVLGAAAALLSLVGLVVLFARRLGNPRVQAVTELMDLVVLLLLIVQVALGLGTALQHPYGAAWGAGIGSAYLWGLLTLRPDPNLVTDLPLVLKLHLVFAWVLIALLPFTRLIHLLALPVGYLWRAPQRVVWNTTRRFAANRPAAVQAETRREFIKGAVGLGGAGALLALGVSEKALTFFKGPRPDPEAEAHLLATKLTRLKQTAEERELEMERRTSAAILVARFSDLSAQKGKYFIAYDMSPGLAFLGADGLPRVLSAKCTHLGCTVGSDVDAQGRVLCPCHVSYFDVESGRPNDGAPAKDPLPQLAWSVVDAAGNVVLSRQPGRPVAGSAAPEVLAGASLYITRPPGEAPA